METALNAKLDAAHRVAEARVKAADARADARTAAFEREVDSRVKDRVAAIERDIYSRHEGAVRSAVAAAVAAEQARQAAGLSIAKSALKVNMEGRRKKCYDILSVRCCVRHW